MADPLLTHFVELIRAHVAGRRCILTGDVAAPLCRQARALAELGAGPCLVVANIRGAGASDEGAQVLLLGQRGAGMMGAIRGSDEALAQLTPAQRAEVDAFDPDGTALVIGALFTQLETFADRPILGARPWAWRRLEDKTLADGLWDAAGVPRAPAEVCWVDEAPRRWARYDQGQGVVWAADNRDGWSGGAHGLRWVRTPAEAAQAAAELGAMADHVRLMPFLDGVPCSIHGMVFPDGAVHALLPMEMVVLRRPGQLTFQYARAASFWRPRVADAEAMRGVARAVGAHLRDAVGYRGTFTVDGVMTRDGFRPTELNPRYGAALQMMTKAGGLPMYLLHLLMAEGLPLDWRPAELAALVRRLAEAHPSGGAMVMVDRPLSAADPTPLVRVGDAWRFAADDEAPHATAIRGPAATGGIVVVDFAPAHVPVGPPVGPAVVALLAFLDQAWQLGVGALEAAADVRGGAAPGTPPAPGRRPG